MNPAAFLWVGIGGALGTMARFAIGLLATRHWGEAFPWGTLAINVAGSFIIAIFSVLSIGGGYWDVSPNTRLFVTVGLCGGFTTFSSFSLQTVALAQQGTIDRAGLYVIASVVCCLVAAWLGFAAGGYINLWSQR